MTERFLFGTSSREERIDALRLTDTRGNSAVIIEYGAAVQSLIINGPQGPVDTVLGYDTVEGYENGTCYYGTSVGRVANRISNASITVDGVTYSLTRNENGNCHHGGTLGMHDVKWEGSFDGETAVFRYHSPDGEEGFPGNMDTEIRYRLDNGALHIVFRAVVDKPCPVNLTNHCYFNLAGSGTILDHDMKIDADRFVETGPGNIPTGRLLEVDGTAFDFRGMKQVGRDIGADHPQLIAARGYDHNYCLNGNGFREVASLECRRSGLGMRLITDMPGAQVYSGNFITEETGKDGIMYGKNSGIALETQYYPDSPNRPEFMDITLRPGDVFSSETVYSFYTL
ncbi:MAG: galactose mutarotase [Oscillospiraceae bacterium]|nr:galactose mutarotase [Oscillospiraceae bacterium]